MTIDEHEKRQLSHYNSTVLFTSGRFVYGMTRTMGTLFAWTLVGCRVTRVNPTASQMCLTCLWWCGIVDVGLFHLCSFAVVHDHR